MLSLILLPIMAFFIGIISAMLGIGGGAFIVPMLILIPCYSLVQPSLLEQASQP